MEIFKSPNSRYVYIGPGENIQTLMRFLEVNKEDMRIGLLPYWIIWFVWKSRNEFLFNKRYQQPIEDLRRVWDSNEE